MNGRDKRRARAERARAPKARKWNLTFQGDDGSIVDMGRFLAADPFEHRRPIRAVQERIERELAKTAPTMTGRLR